MVRWKQSSVGKERDERKDKQELREMRQQSGERGREGWRRKSVSCRVKMQ